MKTLRLKDKVIYGLAGIGDGTAYCLIATFLMFFLTTVAGIQPAVAGMIVAIGSLWDVLCGPFVGYFSDNCTCKWGKRRPFIFIGAIPLALTSAALFTFFEMPPLLKIIYYTGSIIIFWSAFSCFFVPYTALGSEMTTDYDERTILRSFTSMANSTGNILGTVVPSLMVDALISTGKDDIEAWKITGLCIGLFSALAIMTTAVGAGDRDKPAVPDESKEKFNLKLMFTEYAEILKLKPMFLLVCVSILALTGLTMFTADRLYFFTYSAGISSKQISFLLMVGCLAGFLAPAVIGLLVKKMDKRETYITILTLTAILFIVFRIWNVNQMWQLVLLMIIFGIGYMSYWQLLPTLLYDICEYDEYVTGKHRSGQLMSLQGLAEAVAEAMGSQILGIVLQVAGFNADAKAQTATAEFWINNGLLIIPAVLILISCVIMIRYPITREKFKEIQTALKKTTN